MRAFWKITRYARAARFWLLLALAALAWLGFGGDARAQTVPPNLCPQGGTCSISEAIAQCEVHRDAFAAMPPRFISIDCAHEAGNKRFHLRVCYSSCSAGNISNSYFGYQGTCPAGTAWNDTTNKCDCPSGTTYTPEGCKSCGELNDDPGYHGVGSIDRSRDFKSACLGGCIYEAVPMQSTCTLVVGAPAGAVDCSGRFAFTGQSCTVGGGEPAEVPPPAQLGQTAPQVCRPAGSGQTFCQKPNGDQCYTASTGKQICWGASETGEKGDGPVLQTRNAGDTPIPPNLTTDGGDTLTSSGDPVTTVTTRNNTTITTTTRNYTTEFGTDAKPDNSGEPDDGSGGTDDSGDDNTSASGGESCDSPPIVSGDAALNMVANQAWATRCAVEEGNAAAVTGDVGDCASPFTVEGTNANAEQLRAMRAQICGDADPNGPWDVAGDAAGVVDGVAGSHGEDQSGGQFTDGVEGGEGDGELDESGLGWSRSCPTLPTVSFMGTSIDFNANGVPLCDWMQLGGQILLILSALLSVRILASGATV